MESVNIVLAWLRETDIPLSKIAKGTGISRKSLYNWKHGGEPTIKSYQKLKEYYYSLPSVKGEDIELTADGSIDADYVIDLQQKRIQSLEDEKHKAVAENMVWENLEYDIEQVLKLRWHWTDPLKIQRAYTDVGDLKVIQKYTGFSIEDISKNYDEGVYYPMNEHPINNLLTDTTVKYMQNTTQTYWAFLSKFKTFVEQQFFPVFVEFKVQNTIPAHAMAYVKMTKDFELLAKTKFFDH